MHTHTAHLTYALAVEDAGIEREGDLAVEFHYHPGAPAFTPRGEYAPTEPPEPETAEILRVWRRRHVSVPVSGGRKRVADEWVEVTQALNILLAEDDWEDLRHACCAEARDQATEAKLQRHPEAA